jgi:uncharacterized membrane protein (UPF0127 family)
MKAINKTKDILIADSIKIANNPLTRGVGLLLHSHLTENEGLLISPCRSIHSVFMRFKFDAVFLDKENIVLHLIKEMKPFRISKHIWKSAKVLELASGVIEKKQIECGDRLFFTD